MLASGAQGRARDPGARASFVLVHGAWHSSFHWCFVADRLRAAGHRVITVDLPGHGVNARYPRSYFADGQRGFESEPSPLKDVTLDIAAHAVIAALQRAQGHTKPVLVGHSLGGTVITRAAELAPDSIRQLVYLAAFLPTRLHSPAALTELPEAQSMHGDHLEIGDAAAIGAVRFNPRGNLDYLAELHSTFYHDVAFEQFLPFAGAMSPDLPLPLWVTENPVSAQRWGKVPRTYIRCTEDRAIPLALQSRMIADADSVTPGNRCDVHSLKSSHSPFVSCPDELAARLLALT